MDIHTHDCVDCGVQFDCGLPMREFDSPLVGVRTEKFCAESLCGICKDKMRDATQERREDLDAAVQRKCGRVEVRGIDA